MCLVQGTQCISFCQESSTIMIHKIIKAINFINKCSPQQHKDRSIIAICQAPGLVLKVFFLFLWILNVKHLDFLKTVVWFICRKIIISYNFILFYFFILLAKQLSSFFLSPLLITSCTLFHHDTCKTKEFTDYLDYTLPLMG